MNIHIKDKDIFYKLKDSVLFSTIVGSKMYGLNDEHSDTDILYICTPCLSLNNSFIQTHHQIQYKEDNVDHLFIDIFSFIRNILSGDSTIGFEALHDDYLLYTNFSYLYENRLDFYNYNIIKSYLGFAKRDIKSYPKCDSSRNKTKKLKNIERSIQSTNFVYNKTFNPYIDVKKCLEDFDPSDNYLEESLEKVNTARHFFNEMLGSNTLNLPKYMDIENQKRLDVFLKDISSSEFYKQKLQNIELDNYLYDINENGIKY